METLPLKSVLSSWPGFVKIRRALEPRRTQGASAKLDKLFGDVEPRIPEPYDLEGLYQRIRESWNRHEALDHVDLRDLRRLPWVAFYSPSRDDRTGQDVADEWLGAKPDIVAQYGSWLSAGRRSRSVLSLLHEFLRVYPSSLPTFNDLRELLYTIVVEGLSSSSVPSLHRWRQRCVEFGLLTLQGDVQFVREFMLNGDDSPGDLLQRAGLDGGLARCGFMRAGIQAYLPELDISDADAVNRLLTLLEWEGRLRFDDRAFRLEIATALLSPFAEQDPEPDVKERLQQFFLRHYGHPRLPSGQKGWFRVPDDLRNVVMRWLVKDAIDKFFYVVEETALDSHWRYRNTFWRAFFDAGMISDAYFVLGRSAMKLTKLQLTTGDDAKAVEGAMGFLRGAQGDQSVLLLRMSGMPGVTVAEWSHNGSCRIWLEGNPNAPRLYEAHYSRQVLMKEADLSQPHMQSNKGYWQYIIRQWLRDNAGVEIGLEEQSYF